VIGCFVNTSPIRRVVMIMATKRGFHVVILYMMLCQLCHCGSVMLGMNALCYLNRAFSLSLLYFTVILKPHKVQYVFWFLCSNVYSCGSFQNVRIQRGKELSSFHRIVVLFFSRLKNLFIYWAKGFIRYGLNPLQNMVEWFLYWSKLIVWFSRGSYLAIHGRFVSISS